MDPADLAGTYTYRSFLNRPEMVDDFLAMDISGKAVNASLVHFTLTGRGQRDTPISDFHYEYDGIILPRRPTGVNQRQTLAGTVLRAADHGSGPDVAPAGLTAGFLAVRPGG